MVFSGYSRSDEEFQPRLLRVYGFGWIGFIPADGFEEPGGVSIGQVFFGDHGQECRLVAALVDFAPGALEADFPAVFGLGNAFTLQVFQADLGANDFRVWLGKVGFSLFRHLVDETPVRLQLQLQKLGIMDENHEQDSGLSRFFIPAQTITGEFRFFL